MTDDELPGLLMSALGHLTVTAHGIDDIVVEITDPDTGTTVATTVPAVDLIRAAADTAGLDTLINPMGIDDVADYTGFSRRAIGNYVADGTMPAPLRFFADWDIHGMAAGPIRNRRMLDECRPRLAGVLAFPGGRGTADMCKIARLAGVPVRRVGSTDEAPRLF